MSDPQDHLTLTQENFLKLKPTPGDLAQAMLLMQAAKRAEQDQRAAQERLVMGAFGSWFKRYWKHVAGIGTIAFAVAGGVWRGWTWLQTEAESQVLERQAAEKQADAVEDNTKALSDLSSSHEHLTERVEGVEGKLETAVKMNELLLELQLRDPKIKRLIRNDDSLKSKLNTIPTVTVDDD